MKVLITGASGLLGRAVHHLCTEKSYDTKALAFTRSDPSKGLVKLDLTDPAAVESCLKDFQPDVIVHTAAERRPDVVENDPAASHAINVEAPASIATLAAQLDKPPILINISTDYVFDGSKPPYTVDDAPNPLNAYGVSKLQGERAVAEHAKPGHFTNLRVPVLYGRTITNDESAVNVLLNAIQPPAGSSSPKKCDAYAVSRIANSVGFETRTDLLDPEYEVDPMAATARPRHCKLDTTVLEEYGVPVTYTSFEDWWRPYLAETFKAKQEEEARIAAEAEEKRRKEEEERKKREAEEAAERERQAEEERRIAAEKAEADAKARAEAEQKAQQERDAQEAERKRQEEAQASQATEGDASNDSQASKATDTEANDATAPSSSTEPADGQNSIDHEPGSPHPSFNSLKARPTPPATSGLPSPTSTHPPSSIKSGHRPDTPPHPHDGTPARSAVPISTTDATPTGSVVDESPLNLAAARERQRLGSTLPQRSLSASSAARLTSLTDESTMFGGAARKSSVSGVSHLDTAAAASRHAPQDSDEDGYGQPSPRTNQATFQDTIVNGSPTPAGRTSADGNAARMSGSIGSLGSSAPSRISADADRAQPANSSGALPASATQPRLYHRPSFDQLQDARDREAYERLHRRNWTFTIKVGDPQRIGDPMTAHIVYTVRTHTDCPNFGSPHFSALRRYRDFRWLHAALVQNNPGIIVPPVPEKVSIGRFNAELVEARRIGLETCINKIANHPLLQQDDDFRLFLESENFAADVKQRDMVKGPIVTPEQKTYKSWGSALLGSVMPSTSSLSSGALSAYSFEETDEWFNEQKMYLDSLENALKGMVKAVSALSTQRKHMVQSMHDLTNVLTTLSGSSLSRSLSTCFAGLAEVKRRAMELEDAQAEADVRQLGTTMYEYERVVGSVRKAFKVRTEVWAKSARQADELRKTRVRFDKYKATNPSAGGAQFQSLLAEVTEAETRALEAQRLFDTVSARCKDEMERLDLERVLDFKRAVAAWLKDMIARQEEVVAEWIAYTNLLGRQTGVQVLAAPETQGGEQQQQQPTVQQQDQQQEQHSQTAPQQVSARAESQEVAAASGTALETSAGAPPPTEAPAAGDAVTPTTASEPASGTKASEGQPATAPEDAPGAVSEASAPAELNATDGEPKSVPGSANVQADAPADESSPAAEAPIQPTEA
ncbi:hypothetical protein L1887_60653 [Cichorium endivia]|nr:hypothetical protein L1887_60653 [Cichorium endivia]